ncbi:hypothetical protein Tco_0389321 [Tanacetum coccineum]
MAHRYRIIKNIRDFCSGRWINHQNCSHGENISSSTSSVGENRHEISHKADHKSVSGDNNAGASKTQANVGQTTNMSFGSTVINGSTGEWLTLDQKVNTYPSVRRFTAIGIGGDDFVKCMVLAVESVIQHKVPQDHVTKRVSSGGKYVSVNIGPIHVVSREQVQAVYSAMRNDDRMKFFL